MQRNLIIEGTKVICDNKKIYIGTLKGLVEVNECKKLINISDNIKRSRRNAHVACLPPEPFDGAFLLLLVQRTPGEERFCI